VPATSTAVEKVSDVTVVVRELLSAEEKVTDKSSSDGRASSRDAESPEVRSNSCSVIRETAAATRNNEQASVLAAAAECVASAAADLTSGASQAAAPSSQGEGRFTADAAPRGTSASGCPATSAAHPAAASSRSTTAGAGRRTIHDDDDDVDGHASQRTGLICRHDVIAKKHHVTNDVSAGCSDLAAMADKKWRKSPDPFIVDDDLAAAGAIEIPDDSGGHDEVSVQRQNDVLTQLLSAKKLELEEARQRFKVCTAVLEDEVERLRQEKDRLLDRLELPEDERCSLSVEQQSLNELSRRLRQCEEQNEELKNENSELRQDLRDAELAMHELHDQFQAEEGVELRELQRELDNTARDCRLLHFKVRFILWRHTHSSPSQLYPLSL